MSRPFMPVIVTANRLRDGVVVYLSADGWVESADTARLASDPAQEKELLMLAEQAVRSCEVISEYAMSVSVNGSVPSPVSVRERIRALGGPSPEAGVTVGSALAGAVEDK